MLKPHVKCKGKLLKMSLKPHANPMGHWFKWPQYLMLILWDIGSKAPISHAKPMGTFSQILICQLCSCRSVYFKTTLFKNNLKI